MAVVLSTQSTSWRGERCSVIVPSTNFTPPRFLHNWTFNWSHYLSVFRRTLLTKIQGVPPLKKVSTAVKQNAVSDIHRSQLSTGSTDTRCSPRVLAVGPCTTLPHFVLLCACVRYSAQTDLPEPVGRPGAELKRTEEEEEDEEEEVSHGWTHTNVTLDGHTLISLMAKIILEQNPPPATQLFSSSPAKDLLIDFCQNGLTPFFELGCSYILTSIAIPT